MAGLLSTEKEKADVYFEIAIPKMLHPEVREDLKTKAFELLDGLADSNTRKGWLGQDFKPEKYTPAAVRAHVEGLCAQLPPEKRLRVETTAIDQDFYCWTDKNRICYHPYALFNRSDRIVVKSQQCGYDVKIDLLLIMSYARDPKTKSQEEPSRKTQQRTPKKRTQKSKKKR